MLGQIQVTYSDREEGSANKVGKMDAIGIDNAEMADKVVHESICSTTSQSRPGGMIVDLIPIYKGDSLEVKMEI